MKKNKFISFLILFCLIISSIVFFLSNKTFYSEILYKKNDHKNFYLDYYKKKNSKKKIEENFYKFYNNLIFCAKNPESYKNKEKYDLLKKIEIFAEKFTNRIDFDYVKIKIYHKKNKLVSKVITQHLSECAIIANKKTSIKNFYLGDLNNFINLDKEKFNLNLFISLIISAIIFSLFVYVLLSLSFFFETGKKKNN